MTLYQVDRVVYEVGRDEDALRSFVADPKAYLADRKLTDAERKALSDCDYAALWSMGAHPFILFNFVRRVLMARGLPPDQITRDYKSTIEPLGRPSYAT
jgi:hypothetical protein